MNKAEKEGCLFELFKLFITIVLFLFLFFLLINGYLNDAFNWTYELLLIDGK